MAGLDGADSIVDELTRADPDPQRLRDFIADPRRFDGGRFAAADAGVLEEAVRQVQRFLGGGDDDTIEKTRPPAIPEIEVPLEPPPRIGRYPVDGELGQGGLGVVYRGRDEERNRPVAIKVLKRRFAKVFERRFYDEAWISKNLPPHPNLVALLDVGVDDRQGPFLVHEFVEGHDLADHPLPMRLEAGRRCLREIAEALAHLHAHRVIHRDLKPSNIRLLTSDPGAAPEGSPVLKVLDLGIAALLSDDLPGGRRTQPGELLGTLRYMAPEQLQRLPIDERTDVYAFGLVAYELLTGRPPFGAATGDLMDRVRSQYQGPNVRRLSGLPTWLERLVVACLSFERMGRPDGFDEILRAINLEQPPRIALKPREQEWRALLATFPPPPVGGINPYKVLHLQRGEVGGRWDFEAHLPPYVRRDVDAELDALLQREQATFVLLAGPSKCGKSRTAFEALARNLGERPLLLPERLEDVRGVLEALPRLQESWPRPILWLDNAHEHLRAQSLSSSLLQQALDQGVVVVATIWDSELAALGAIGPIVARSVDTAVLRAAREVLQHARIVRLEGAISTAERQRAEALYPELAFDAGLGETFVARELLLQRFDHGSRELKALVWALVDCTRAGLLDGTPLSVLREVMPAYLEQADPGAWLTRRRVERMLERALAQGTEPVGVHQRLILHVGNDTFKVYDPLRYHVEQSADRSRALPPALWQAVLGSTQVAVPPAAAAREVTASEPSFYGAASDERTPAVGASRPQRRARRADSEDVTQGHADVAKVNWVVAGLTAWQSGLHRVAEEAYRIGMRQGSTAAACSLGALLESVGDLQGAASAYQIALELGDHTVDSHLAMLRGERQPVEGGPEQPSTERALGIAVRQRTGVAVLELTGALTLGGGYRALHDVVHREMDGGARRFLLDLRAVSAIDPAGLGALVGALAAATVNGRTLRLCRVPADVARTLITHGLIRIFEIFDSEEEALAPFR